MEFNARPYGQHGPAWSLRWAGFSVTGLEVGEGSRLACHGDIPLTKRQKNMLSASRDIPFNKPMPSIARLLHLTGNRYALSAAYSKWLSLHDSRKRKTASTAS